MSLKPVLDILTRLANTRDKKTKMKIINASKGVTFFKEVVVLAYDGIMTFNINKFPEKRKSTITKHSTEDALKFLRFLSTKRGASQAEVNNLHSLCEDDETCVVIKRILNKDLRCGIAARTWCEVFPEITRHELMLCYYAVRYSHRYDVFSEDLEKFVAACGGWQNIIGSVKADGVRAWAVVRGKTVEYLSRTGKPYENFNILNADAVQIAEHMMEYNGNPTNIIDCEVIIEGENFQEQMKQVRRMTDVDPSKFRMIALDSPSLPKMTQLERSSFLGSCVEDARRSTFVEEFVYDGFEDFKQHFLSLVAEGREGLVLKNAHAYYDYRRSPHWCKVKDFFSADLKVTGFEMGTGKYEGVLGALLVDFNGVEVRVGSGYSDFQRKDFIKNMPKIIEVEYKRVTADGSLQFPTFVKEREDLC